MKNFILITIFLIFPFYLLSQTVAVPTDGSQGVSIDIPPPTPVFRGGDGGGGHRQIDLDFILKALQEGKNQKPQEFDELKKLLYIEPFTTKEYDENLVLGLYVPNNKTLARNEKVDIAAYIENPNPIQIRRALYLQLEVLDPGRISFRQVNPVPQIIQVNEYEETKDNKNSTLRSFPELTSFSYLKNTGPAVLRLKATDGSYLWTSKNVTLNIVNNPPMLTNLSVESPESPRYNDPIDYVANVSDKDGDVVNVTLHILDDRGREHGNASQIVMSGKGVRFSSSQYGFFGKEDEGKNFSYHYTFGDGINVSHTAMHDGPHLRNSTTIWVDNPRVIPEEESQYWWQSYNFSIDLKNQEQGKAKVVVTLLTDTKAHPWKAVGSQELVASQDPKVVYFNAKPFDVLDANQTFRFKFMYSEYDQHQKDYTEVTWPKPLGAKLVKYDMASIPGIANLLGILLLSLMAGIIIERRLYR